LAYPGTVSRKKVSALVRLIPAWETIQIIAFDPSHLDPNWAHYKQTMPAVKPDLKTKKLIAYLVSVMNNCEV
jgi:hypothetical protein